MYFSKIFLIIVVWSFIGNIEALPWERKFDLNEYREQADSSEFDLNEYREQADSSDYLDTELKRTVTYKQVCEEKPKNVSVATLDKKASGNDTYVPKEVWVYSCHPTQTRKIASGLVCKPLERSITVIKWPSLKKVTVKVAVGCVAHEIVH